MVWFYSTSAEQNPDLCTVVVKDAHQAHGHSLVDTAAQSFPGKCKHEGYTLFTTHADDGVERLVQATCEDEFFYQHEALPRSRLDISPAVEYVHNNDTESYFHWT